MFEIDYDPSKPKTIAIASRNNDKLYNVDSSATTKREAITQASLTRNLKQAKTSQNSRQDVSAVEDYRWNPMIKTNPDGAMSIHDATTAECEDEQNSYILF